MKKLAIIAAAAALCSFGRSAQAQLIDIGPVSSDVVDPGALTITGSVQYNAVGYSGLYLYTYTFTTNPSSDPVTTMQVGSAADPVFDTAGISFVPGSNADDYAANGIIYITFLPNQTSPETVQYTSAYGPGDYVWSALDGGPEWGTSSAGFNDILAPVPEASTVMAGALMLLPLGIGAVRAIRKERAA